MNQKLTSPMLWVAILGALKLLLDIAGIQIPSDKIDAIANGIAATLTTIGIIIDHGNRKAVQPVVAAPVVVPQSDVPPVIQ